MIAGELTGQKIVASRWTTRQPPPPRDRCGVCDSPPDDPSQALPKLRADGMHQFEPSRGARQNESDEAQWGDT